jgi:hypothetical protein
MQLLKRFTDSYARTLWLALTFLWIGGIVGGMFMLAWHAASPGGSQPSPTAWPQGSQVKLSSQAATLVMFVHPHCPCTRASLEELQKLVARRAGLAACWVVFFQPENADEHWPDSDLRATVAAIPGVHVLTDVDGREAHRFGVLTSGHTLLYGADGKLLFSGGITAARGHAGDNDGRSSLESLLAGATTPVRQTAVFGCPILVPGERK